MAYDDEYDNDDDDESTLRMRPISVPDPNLPGSTNRAASRAQQKAAQADARRAWQEKARQAPSTNNKANVSDETRIISPATASSQPRQAGLAGHSYVGRQAGQPASDETRVINMPGSLPPSMNGRRTSRSTEATSDLRSLESGAFQESDEEENPEYGLTADQIAAKKKAKASKARLITWVTLAVIAILAIGGGAGWWLWRNAATNAALTSCQNASTALAQATQKFNAEKKSPDLQTALTATSDQVVDGSLISSLHDNNARTAPRILSCSTSLGMGRLASNARVMAQDAADLTRATASMKSDVKGIADSKNAKQVAAARQTLNQLITSAQQTASSQASNVQDDATITALNSAISAGQKLVNEPHAKLDDLNQAIQNIRSAVQAVNASVQDKQAAEQQQREQERNNNSTEGNQSNQGQNSGNSGNNYSSGNSGTNGQQNGTTQPQNGNQQGAGNNQSRQQPTPNNGSNNTKTTQPIVPNKR